MKRISLKTLHAAAKDRPAGYLAAVMAAGFVEADFLWLDDAAYESLCLQFSQRAPRPSPTVLLSKQRFDICLKCPDARDNGFGCAHHAGCCFGQWRGNPANQCPAGRWPPAPSITSIS